MTKDREDGDEATADDPVMRSMRSVWLTMRDEDPPQRGMAELLAAARAQAESMQPKPSWWRRTFAVMWRPPVLALATTIVLVGGALVVNNRTEDLEVGTTQETPRRERLDSLEPPAPRERDTGSVAPAEPAGMAPAAPDPSSTIVTEAPRVPPRTTRGARPIAPPPPPPKDDDHAELGGRVATATDKPGTKAAASEQDGLLIAGEGAPDATADVATSTVRPQATVATTRTGPPQPELVEQLVKQTEVAAGRKDCPAVRATAARVKKLDANVYKARVAKQPAIATCLQ